jgi:hypothetical protein
MKRSLGSIHTFTLAFTTTNDFSPWLDYSSHPEAPLNVNLFANQVPVRCKIEAGPCFLTFCPPTGIPYPPCFALSLKPITAQLLSPFISD